MRVSTKGRYGLRILLDVAVYQAKGPVALRDISKRQAISQKYMWQVVNPLKVSGILRATRGAHGGYVLARPPSAISMRDVVDVLEGEVSVAACVQQPQTCCRGGDCTAREAWSQVERKLNEALESITLQDLIEREQERLRRNVAVYDI